MSLKDEIKVSIITVCFNSQNTISRTIESVLNQTYPNIEYIIVDGKSTDNTLEIINSYSEKYGDRLKVISEKDEGIYDAMNKGIHYSSGTLIGIVNSDDYYEPDAVECMVEAWNGEPMQILHGLMRSLRYGREYSVMLTSAEFLDEKMIQHPSCFVTRDVYDKIGLFDISYRCISDYEFMIRAFESHKVSFKPVYHIIANFDEGGISESSQAKIEKLKYLKKRKKISWFSYWIMYVFYPLKSKIYRRIWR